MLQHHNMRILALELSTARGSLAWSHHDSNYSREWPHDRKNSVDFFENLDHVTKKFGAPDIIIVGLGPGSYAGTHLIGFPSICAIECLEADYCVIGDARRKSFFFARTSGNELTGRPDLFREEELESKLASLRSDTPVFCSESLPQFERAVVRYPAAIVLARLAQDPQRRFSLPPLEPMYLREPHITMPKTATSR
jgi:tRNA A37 threonylcarbamoyladenosine modification protein TsaB